MNILFFSSKLIQGNGGEAAEGWHGSGSAAWLNGRHHLAFWGGRCMLETGPNYPFGRKSQNYFLCPLCGSWEWIKFLEIPCKEWRQEPSGFLMAPLSEGMPFFQLFGLDLRALNISLFFVFPLPCPLSFPSLWKAEVQLFLIACLKLSWVLCFWTWLNDYSLRAPFY